MPSKYEPMLEGLAMAVDRTQADTLPTSLAGAHAIIAGARTKFDGSFMDEVPLLRVIARTGIGVDNVDIPSAMARASPCATCLTVPRSRPPSTQLPSCWPSPSS